MKAYIPIPDGAVVSKHTVEALLQQVSEVVSVECGDYYPRNDGRRFIAIGKGRVKAMAMAVESGEPFFVVQNAGCLHISGDGIVRAWDFLINNPEWAAVSLMPQNLKPHSEYVKGECVIYRTDAVKEIEKDIDWGVIESEGKKIKRALLKQGWKFGYFENEYGHIRDIGLATFHKSGQPLNAKGYYKTDPLRESLDAKRKEHRNCFRQKRASRVALKGTNGKPVCN